MPIPFRTRLRQAAKLIVSGEKPQASAREIPAITAAEVAEAKEFFPMDKFFIFGHARSGTTMLARLIRQHPQVHCNYQAHFFSRPPFLHALAADPAVGEWLSRRSNRWNRGSDLSPVVLRAAADFILEREARRAGKTIVGDKSPNNLVHGKAIQWMHNIYPDGRVIYIARDGRDAALSHRIQGFIDFPEQLSKEDLAIRSDFGRDPAPYLRGERSLFTPSGLRREAENWARNVVETDAAAKALFPERYLWLRYEDLLEQPEAQMLRVWHFLAADVFPEDSSGRAALLEALALELKQNPDADYQHQKAGEIAQSLQKGKRGSWHELFTQNDRQIFSEVAGKVLSTWGYP